ncbi:MAG TPA: phosphatase PAP2 family protein [Mycobacteriales bacterium]|jgi:undecaprenyl-diphosphatase|nr:phosphatase PAP2 family protein [Mycobacteriales bacterium]
MPGSGPLERAASPGGSPPPEGAGGSGRWSRALWAGLLLVLLGQQVVAGGPLVRLDRAIETALVPHRDNITTELAKLLSRLGDAALVVPLLVALAVAVGLRHRSWRLPLRSVALIVALTVAVLLLKDLVGRPAPHGATTHGGAWPSGHTATATVVWGAAARLLHLRRPARLWTAVGIPVLVGTCLVLAGYHQVGDVLAGWALGALLLAVWDLSDGSDRPLRVASSAGTR